MNDKIKIIKDTVEFNIGDVFWYDECSDMYIYRSENEDISKDSYTRTVNKIQLSKDIIDNLIKCGAAKPFKEITPEDFENAKKHSYLEDDCLEEKSDENCEVEDENDFNWDHSTDIDIDWEAYNLGLEMKQVLNRMYGAKQSEG